MIYVNTSGLLSSRQLEAMESININIWMELRRTELLIAVDRSESLIAGSLRCITVECRVCSRNSAITRHCYVFIIRRCCRNLTTVVVRSKKKVSRSWHYEYSIRKENLKRVDLADLMAQKASPQSCYCRHYALFRLTCVGQIIRENEFQLCPTVQRKFNPSKGFDSSYDMPTQDFDSWSRAETGLGKWQ